MRLFHLLLATIAGVGIGCHFYFKPEAAPPATQRPCDCRRVINRHRPWRYDDGRQAPAGASVTGARGAEPPPPY